MVMPVMQYAPETCAWCEGKGKYGQYNDICLVCNGQGSVLVAQPSHKCPHCAGTGVLRRVNIKTGAKSAAAQAGHTSLKTHLHPDE